MSITLTAPRQLPEVARFWEGTALGQLLIKRCTACGEVHFYPRDICPHCLSDATEWVQASGTGTVYSFSTMKRPGPEGAPYTIAFVTLDEGITLMTNLVDVNPDTLGIGSKVKVVFLPSKAKDGTAGAMVPVFTPL
jgi:uncharacterized protein